VFKIPTVLTADKLLDKAFGRAQKIKKRDRKAERISKISSAKDTLDSTLQKYVSRFPSFDNLHRFYYELFDILLGIDTLKKSLGAVDWGRKQINEIARHGIKEVKRQKDGNLVLRQTYGRISSVLYQINNHLLFLERARKKLRKVPFIDMDKPTLIIAGYPNVGKSSLMRLISTAEPTIASYPFTTKEIIVGDMALEDKKGKRQIQIIEAPGLLDRPHEKRSAIERQGLIALRYLSDLIVFIVDASLYCGYDLKSQLNLLKEIQSEFKGDIIAVENKADIGGGATDFLKISCISGRGIEELKKGIMARLS